MRSPDVVFTGPPAVADAAKAHDAAVEKYREAIELVQVAESDLRTARAKREADVRAAATKGNALPSTSSIEKAEQKVTEAKERRRETDWIRAGKGRALCRAIAEAAPEWRATIADERQKALERHRVAAEQYAAATREVAAVLGLGTWLHRCETTVAKSSNAPDLPAFPAPESVFPNHLDPLAAVEKFAAWLNETSAVLDAHAEGVAA